MEQTDALAASSGVTEQCLSLIKIEPVHTSAYSHLSIRGGSSCGRLWCCFVVSCVVLLCCCGVVSCVVLFLLCIWVCDLFLFLQVYAKVSRRLSMEQTDALAASSGVTEQCLSLIKIVRSHGTNEKEVERYRGALDVLLRLQSRQVILRVYICIYIYIYIHIYIYIYIYIYIDR